MATDKPNAILILSASTRPFQGCPTLLQKCNKEQLVVIASMLRKLLFKCQISYHPDSDANLVKAAEQLKTQGERSFKKSELDALLRALLGNIINIINLTRAIAPNLMVIWKTLATTPDLTMDVVDDIYGRQVELFTIGSYYHEINFVPEPLFFPMAIYSYYRSYNTKAIPRGAITVSVDPEVRSELLAILFGYQSCRMKAIDSIPAEDADLPHISFDNTLPQAISYLHNVGESGAMFTSTGSVTASKINSISKKMQDFTHSDAPDTYRLAISRYLTMAYMHFYAYCSNVSTRHADHIPLSTSIADFGKFVIEHLSSYLLTASMNLLLPGVKGISATICREDNSSQIKKAINEILSEMDTEWYTMDRFVMQYMQIPASFSHVNKSLYSLFPKNSLYNLRTQNTTNVDWWTDITRPFIVNWLYMLAACGILDLIIDPNDTSHMNGIKYARLTLLGRYALGKTDSYDGPNIENSHGSIEIDDRNGILYLTNPNSPYGLLLDKIGRKIGAGRYHISAQSLVAAAKDTVEAIKLRDKLKSLISDNTNPYWTEMMSQIDQRIACRMHIPGEYLMYKLNPDVPGLIETIASNSEIRTNCILAEDSVILIKYTFNTRFIQILHQNGYIL